MMSVLDDLAENDVEGISAVLEYIGGNCGSVSPLILQKITESVRKEVGWQLKQLSNFQSTIFQFHGRLSNLEEKLELKTREVDALKERLKKEELARKRTEGVVKIQEGLLKELVARLNFAMNKMIRVEKTVKKFQSGKEIPSGLLHIISQEVANRTSDLSARQQQLKDEVTGMKETFDKLKCAAYPTSSSVTEDTIYSPSGQIQEATADPIQNEADSEKRVQNYPVNPVEGHDSTVTCPGVDASALFDRLCQMIDVSTDDGGHLRPVDTSQKDAPVAEEMSVSAPTASNSVGAELSDVTSGASPNCQSLEDISEDEATPTNVIVSASSTPFDSESLATSGEIHTEKFFLKNVRKSRSFKTRQDLSISRHISRHCPNAARFSCEKCGSNFRYSFHLRKHSCSPTVAIAKSFLGKP